MQPKLPCDVCNKAFREKAINAYHAWFNGQNRTSFRQRTCLACWQQLYQAHSRHFISREQFAELRPDTCPSCGEGIIGDDDLTWSTWYRGNDRRDTVVAYCGTCAAALRMLMMQGADRQPDRQEAGVGAGGAPLPNSQWMVGRNDLPW